MVIAASLDSAASDRIILHSKCNIPGYQGRKNESRKNKTHLKQQFKTEIPFRLHG